jgi:hypothetical protein
MNCPACGQEVGAGAAECPRCHLPESLFAAVRDVAGAAATQDPTYLRTIGELLATVDRDPPPAPALAPGPGLIGRSARFPSLRPAPAPAPPVAEFRSPAAIPQLKDLPVLPAGAPFAETRRRLDEYFLLGRRLGLDFTDFERRFGAATLSDDLGSLDVLVREMFVHLASGLAEEYDSALARRNELAQLMPTRSADVEFEAIRRAISNGDLAGAQRRLVHVRDELLRAEEEWEVGRILTTECDLLVDTLRDLGGDPTPALTTLEEGRAAVRRGRKTEAERLLARSAMVLWALLEPRFMDDLRRLRDRMLELRGAGGDVAPALRSLRDVAAELKQRNFGGTIVAYRSLKSYMDRVAAPESLAPIDATSLGRPAPSI